ncbi:hypothetical protein MKW94_004262 [Papaver nudicaule]|uniref:Uncharacterized protein n=1 Tax=Papaver nudicaule TaxID=74823 RepID=A0AA42AW88_PAPNU|nr:hypothetical protein [Papaver nudicaule]
MESLTRRRRRTHSMILFVLLFLTASSYLIAVHSNAIYHNHNYCTSRKLRQGRPPQPNTPRPQTKLPRDPRPPSSP